MKYFYLAVMLGFPVYAYAAPLNVNLGTAASFAVLAGTTATNTGDTSIFGNLGVSPGGAVTGFPPGAVSGGTIHAADDVAGQAQIDLTTAYVYSAAQACGDDLTGKELGGLILTPGVYCFSSDADLTGALTLDAQGNPDAKFLFQIGSSLTVASAATVGFTNGAEGGNVYWQVGSSATLGTSARFEGSILALTSISLDTGANIPCGRALARNGAVTMDDNQISIDVAGCQATAGASTPEPDSALFALLLLAGFSGLRRLCNGRVTREQVS